ncbi:MAG: hypothetical protein ACJAQW_002165, partial [Paracoccaceae bacterium]
RSFFKAPVRHCQCRILDESCLRISTALPKRAFV